VKLEVMLAKLAADASKPMPAPQPLGIKQPTTTGLPASAAPPKPPALGPPRPPALKAPAPTPAPKPAMPTPPPAPQPPVTPAPAPGGGGGFGDLVGGLHGIASGSSPADIGKFMGAMAPVTKGIAGVGGLPAIAGIMDHVRGGDSLSTLLRGPGA
jgi:hypothetical protein